MIILTETVTKTKQTTMGFDDWIMYLKQEGTFKGRVMNVGSQFGHRQEYRIGHKNSFALQILSFAVKKYKWDLIKTFDGCKIILRGGKFYKIETTGQLAEAKTISAFVVIQRLEDLNRKGKLDLTDLTIES